MSSKNPVILSFDNVSFSYNYQEQGEHHILEETSFSVRENTKITIMGQNWAGKSTIFKLITWELKPQSGKINVVQWNSIAISRQLIPRDQLTWTVKQYFESVFTEKDYQLDRKIADALKAVNLVAALDKQLKDFSGWQQARLLLAQALIQEPDILLMDEPTNNLDKAGIGDLITFLLTYEKTVIVISHDADFLNMFTDWVLYLNKNNNQVEQYWGDYYTVVETIAAQIEKEKMQNARAEKKIEDAKEKINFFSNKWGKMRKLASKMRDAVEEAEENKVDVRKDDKTINSFTIDFENFVGPIVQINNISLMNRNQQIVKHELPLTIKKWQRYILSGPNGIWKSTLLKRLVGGTDNDAIIDPNIRIWYYSQDFNALDMNMVVWDSLHDASDEVTDQTVYRTAAQFLLTGSLLKSKIATLSEWQKWLLSYARFVIQKPHLLILDEPTNHINFRHLPVIAQAINDYKWAILMVSHDHGFVDQISDLQTIDLGKLI